MKKKLISFILMTMASAFALTACGNTASENAASTNEAETIQEEVVDDQAKADEVAALIDAIYVQSRNENTDAQCKQAKEAWDALTDAQKELVEGENADPDYFGRDTGDASMDDPRNADEIGENEILVVSFGTSFNDSRVADIKAIEDAIAAAFPEWSVRRAFTAQIIINHVQARDDEHIDNMEQALERAVANGVKNLIVQPTHLMHGAEYDEMCEMLAKYEDKFELIAIAEPLLGSVGDDATVINADKKAVAEAVVSEAVKEAGYADIKEAEQDGAAFVLMGHGTSHTAKVSYSQMQTQFDKLGYSNVFVGTVEGEPEETECSNVIEAVKEAGYTKVYLRPLMVVAGDHANNDMAGDDEDSWKSMFVASGNFEEVNCQIAGLGRIEALQELYVSHTRDAIENADVIVVCNDTDEASVEELKDGVYDVAFDTDSSMFHVNEACNGVSKLTVKDGKMTVHISLVSKKIVNLFVGVTDDAVKEGAAILEPTIDTLTYADGTTEEVYGFDVPVPYLNEEFDLANLGESGKWFDHKVSVTLIK